MESGTNFLNCDYVGSNPSPRAILNKENEMNTESFQFNLTVTAIPCESEKFPRNANAMEILDDIFSQAISSAQLSIMRHMSQYKCEGPGGNCDFCKYLEAKIKTYEEIRKGISSEDKKPK